MGMYLDIARRVAAQRRASVSGSEKTDSPPSRAQYTYPELKLIDGLPPRVRATVDAIKGTFGDTGGSTVMHVGPDPTWPRRQAAGLIRKARHVGDRDRAVAMRDRWRERLSIVAADPDCALFAEQVAYEEVKHELNSGAFDPPEGKDVE